MTVVMQYNDADRFRHDIVHINATISRPLAEVFIEERSEHNNPTG